MEASGARITPTDEFRIDEEHFAGNTVLLDEDPYAGGSLLVVADRFERVIVCGDA